MLLLFALLLLVLLVLPLLLLVLLLAMARSLQRQLLRSRCLVGVKDAPVSCCIQGVRWLLLVCSCSCVSSLPVPLAFYSQQLPGTSPVVDQLPLLSLLSLLLLQVQVVQVKVLIPRLLALPWLLQLLLWLELPRRLAPPPPLPRLLRLLLLVFGRADGRKLCALVAPARRAPATKAVLRPQLLAGAADRQRPSVSQHCCCRVRTDAVSSDGCAWPLGPVGKGGSEQVWLGRSSCSCRRATCRRGVCRDPAFTGCCCKGGTCTSCGCIHCGAASLRSCISSRGAIASRARPIRLSRLGWQQQVCPLPLAVAACCTRVPSCGAAIGVCIGPHPLRRSNCSTSKWGGECSTQILQCRIGLLLLLLLGLLLRLWCA